MPLSPSLARSFFLLSLIYELRDSSACSFFCKSKTAGSAGREKCWSLSLSLSPSLARDFDGRTQNEEARARSEKGKKLVPSSGEARAAQSLACLSSISLSFPARGRSFPKLTPLSRLSLHIVTNIRPPPPAPRPPPPRAPPSLEPSPHLPPAARRSASRLPLSLPASPRAPRAPSPSAPR